MKTKLQLLSHSAPKAIRRGVALMLLASLLGTSGCFGVFPLTRQVYNYNKNASDIEFVQTLVFWAFLIIPVYFVSSFVDAIVFNPIEFWSGKAVDLSSADEGVIKLNARTAAGAEASLLLRRCGPSDFAVLNPGDNAVIGRIQRADNGDTLLCNAEGHVLKRLPQLASAR